MIQREKVKTPAFYRKRNRVILTSIVGIAPPVLFDLLRLWAYGHWHLHISYDKRASFIYKLRYLLLCLRNKKDNLIILINKLPYLPFRLWFFIKTKISAQNRITKPESAVNLNLQKVHTFVMNFHIKYYSFLLLQ